MARQLTQREKRMLQIGAVCVIAIPALTYGTNWLDHWGKIRTSLAAAKRELNGITIDNAKRAGLLSLVPVFEAPQPEETQKFLFRDKLYEQLKKAGIKNEPLTFLAVKATKKAPYKVLRIKCKGQCKFEQLLDFLAVLKENPYLVGIEELSIQCDTKEPPEKRKNVEINLTVSTFVKPPSTSKKKGTG
jgi:hypothetical protein